ncbi:MAG: 4-carboxy-4-hydroxy-2-oxoadipate aldolase/oxaloacetate decarboxylase [Rhodospirillales bacterium]|jgi:4-hydroxy-4-methyl-2-oxoglutarate aldolase|nr:4-carboxy-4-hydroxy-2-oxoadipate aldolase/oxaloacetate decarboxylase [Rhodospirillales bacterium]MBT4007291.1 4-carboxy-4-hydroxy-2-oxoadipate aldolase/oxaloacetate decarboxylase [Rhodospirillales bacterium]MBT5077004.1 4-carboxy-4-hydroxy-2-oxoadipate aldolase/oxaloacetate decarboxylase [Rhodospirillales bacterium]MBT5113624.1 4-carboxy-4-hydroxy-2-oxoadipate aldolase/oxaloacetate decarboxylase [Rhodospirillales bacterium]MBT5673922.1 4-carboxy-4-hydroxy-2-oxoadipate aldolase/oxaloacetate d
MMTRNLDDFQRPDPALLARARVLPSATIHEAMGRIGALPAILKPVIPGMVLCGPAVTVKAKPINNINLHRAIYRARPGDVLVVDVGDGYEAGYFGEIMAHAATMCKLGGMVINGCVRDADLLEEIGFPVFSRGLAIRGTLKEEGGGVNLPITMGDVLVNPGDLVVGDRDGVVVVAQANIETALGASEAREAKELAIIEDIKAGQRTLDMYGWTDGTGS